MLASSFRIFISILFLLVSSGCLRSHRTPAPGDSTEVNTTDFRVDIITGPSIPNSSKGIWKAPISKTYEFKACLIGRMTNAQLPSGQKFKVQTPEGIIFDDEGTTTDDLGCIYWKETIPFSLSNDSNYIELVRTISGKGTYQGVYEQKIGVNPWKTYRGDSSPEVIDLNRNNILKESSNMISEVQSKSSYFQYIDGKPKTKLLIQQRPILDIVLGRRVKEGREVTIKISMNPFMRPLNLNGDRGEAYKFQSGEFKVYAQLVVMDSGKVNETASHLLTEELLPKNFKVALDGTLNFEKKTKLSTEITSGQIHLALKVAPVNSPFPLAPYEGLHIVGNGEFAQIFGAKGVTQTKGDGGYSDEDFNYGELVQNSDNYKKLKDAGFARKLPAVEFSNLQPRFVRLSSGETATQRTLVFQTSTVATDPILGTPIKNQTFLVKRSYDGVIVKAPTDHTGYMVWMDEITHLYYAPIQYFFPKPEITHVETGYKEARELAINPWDEGWTFGKDTKGLEADFKAAADRTQRKPMFIIDAFRYQTIRFRYVIDQFLTLNVKKAVVMTFDPLVQRFGIQKDRYFEPLRDGIYLMKIALVKYYIDPFKNKTNLKRDKESGEYTPYIENYEPGSANAKKRDHTPSYSLVESNGEQVKDQFTTVVKKLIRVQGGRITTPVEFSMRDLRMMSIRNNLIVQIETIDENELMRDNLINEKINELQDDYDRYNDPRTSEEERKQMLTDKFNLLKLDRKLILEAMDNELDAVLRERKILSAPFFEGDRFNNLEQLKANLKNQKIDLKNYSDFIDYKNTMNLKREEFAERVNVLRKDLKSMDIQMKDSWKEWSDAYLDSFKVNSLVSDFPYEDTNLLNLKQKSDAQDKALMKEYSKAKKEGLPVVPEENRFARVSYYDYLSSMQIFSKKAAIGINIEMSDLERLKINNYTENPATPLIDLDRYKNDAGLAPRSFIGPCTFVENDNMSDMRPTDTLDESSSGKMDSSQVLYKPKYEADNSRFENSAYHDSISPFKVDLKKVETGEELHYNTKNDSERFPIWKKDKEYLPLLDKYIGEHIGNETRYERQMEAISQIGNFTKIYNLEYVSLDLDGKERKLKTFDNNCKFEELKDGNTICLKERRKDQTLKKDFLYEMNAIKVWPHLRKYFFLNPMSRLKRQNEKLIIAKKTEYEFPSVWNELFASTYDLFDSAVEMLDNLGVKRRYIKDDNLEDDVDPMYSQQFYKDAKKFLDEKLDGKFRNFETMDAANWISGGLEKLRLPEAIKLCNLLSNRSVNSLRKHDLIDTDRKVWFKKVDPKEYLMDKCLESIKYMPVSDEVHLTGMTFDRRYRIIKPGEYTHLSGKSMNINVGDDISISNYRDIGRAASVGTNGALLGLAAMAISNSPKQISQNIVKGAIITASKAPHPLAGVLKGALLAGGGLMIASNTATTASGLNEGVTTAISEAVFLVVQKAEMLFTIEEHEKCLVTQFTRGFIDDLNMKHLGIKEGVKKQNADLARSLGRGFFICGGKVIKKPIQVKENFYYITQHFTAGDMLDEANLLNHVWLLALRGTHDYNNFLRVLKAQVQNREGNVLKNTEALYEYPLHHLNRVYERVIPSFPGMYSVPYGCDPINDKNCELEEEKDDDNASRIDEAPKSNNRKRRSRR